VSLSLCGRAQGQAARAWARITAHGLPRDVTQLSIGQALRLAIQAAYFVLIARSLGPDAFGAFVTVVAMAALLGPFSGIGAANLFIKNVRSGQRSAAVCWGNGLLLIGVSGTLLSILGLVLSECLRLKSPDFVVAVVGFADLVWLKISELAASGFTALDRMGQTSMQNVVVCLLRLAGITVLVVIGPAVTLNRWVIVYFFATVGGAAYAVVKATKAWGRPHVCIADLRTDMAEGVFFSISGSATTVYNDIDKIMLNRLSDLAATGVYGAAYRIIDVSMTPVRSLAAAAYPQFFRKGLSGIAATYAYARSLIAKAVVYGCLAGLALWLLAPLLPHILGAQYREVVLAIRWLALIPFLRCVHSFLADSLSGAGRQAVRTGIQVMVAAMNIVANVLVLPVFSWRGAAWTSLGCDGLLVVLFWGAVLYCRRRDIR
jgi:O-antigen/teichoic acid export membrane protein